MELGGVVERVGEKLGRGAMDMIKIHCMKLSENSQIKHFFFKHTECIPLLL